MYKVVFLILFLIQRYFGHIIYSILTESDLNFNYKTEANKGLRSKIFDEKVIFAKTKETGKT